MIHGARGYRSSLLLVWLLVAGCCWLLLLVTVLSLLAVVAIAVARLLASFRLPLAWQASAAEAWLGQGHCCSPPFYLDLCPISSDLFLFLLSIFVFFRLSSSSCL
jgi:hypothetical protein